MKLVRLNGSHALSLELSLLAVRKNEPTPNDVELAAGGPSAGSVCWTPSLWWERPTINHQARKKTRASRTNQKSGPK